MERFIFFVLAVAVIVGLAAPNGHSSTAQLNQQILVDANLPASGASGSADETTMSPSYGGDTELHRGPGGHFYTDASINGQSLPFVVDTGATSVALTVNAARAAGIYVDPSSFTVVGTGASGATRGTRVTINHLEVAGRTVDNVDAVVLEGLEINLLGQSVLSRFGSIEMKGDRMMLR